MHALLICFWVPHTLQTCIVDSQLLAVQYMLPTLHIQCIHKRTCTSAWLCIPCSCTATRAAAISTHTGTPARKTPRTRLRGGGQLQPVLHVPLLVVAAQQALAGRRHHLVRQVLQQVVQQAGVACAAHTAALRIQGYRLRFLGP